jgi:PAS domain S-box-containing protein
VSGSNDDLGIIKSCNKAASRVFGYNMDEMVKNPVEKLMPAFIAKHHQKILRKALNSPPDHSTKDKNVYALHKSGYVFPIFLQIKFM